MDITKLKADYESACNAFVKAFCKKHDFYFSDAGWVANKVGEIINFGDYYFDMPTIITDIVLNAGKDKIMVWYDYCVKVGLLGCKTINFESYLKGCPLMSDEKIKELEELKEKSDEAKRIFEEAVKNFKNNENNGF